MSLYFLIFTVIVGGGITIWNVYQFIIGYGEKKRFEGECQASAEGYEFSENLVRIMQYNNDKDTTS